MSFGIVYAHWVSLFLYITIIVTSVYNIWSANRILRWPWSSAVTIPSVLASISAGLFMFLQFDWILSDHNSNVGTVTSLLWLAWDYFNALTYIFFNLLIGSAMKIYQINRQNGTRCDKNLCDPTKHRIPCIEEPSSDVYIFTKKDFDRSKSALDEIEHRCTRLKDTADNITKKSH